MPLWTLKNGCDHIEVDYHAYLNPQRAGTDVISV